MQNDSVTDIKATTELGIISFEQEQPVQSQPDLTNEAHYIKEDTARLRDFDTLELANQVNNARRQLSKTPDASRQTKTPSPRAPEL